MMWWLLALGLAAAQDIAIKADKVYPVAGPVIESGVVLVSEGKIKAVGAASEIPLPAGVRVVEGKVAVPGLIDGLSVAGLSGAQNQSFDQDHRETGSRVMPELRALDAYNAHDGLVGYLREFGVTTLQTGPSPGALVGARTLVTKTSAKDVSEIAIVEDGWVVVTMGERARGTNSRMGTAAGIRQSLADAVEYNLRRKLPLADRPPVDLGKEALVEALQGKRRVVVHAHQANDIQTALRIGEEFGLRLVIAGAAEGYLVRDALAEADIPVLVGPVMLRAWNASGEAGNASFENAALLAAAGVKVGFMSGFEGYVPKVRVVLWEAAIAAANGFGFDAALYALTLGNAQLLGIDERVGSLEVGKDADIALFDGDPFEYTSHACTVLIEGEIVSDTCR